MGTETPAANPGVNLSLDPTVAHYFYTLRDHVGMTLSEEPGTAYAVLVTGCRRRSGVTAVALNLAVALSQTVDGRVLLCDANIVHPRVHEILGLEVRPGLSDVVQGRVDLRGGVRPTSLEDVDVLAAGGRSANPSMLLQTGRLRQLVRAAKEDYTFTVIDAPPVLEYSATAVLGAASDGVVLVVEAETDRYEVARRARTQLAAAGATVLGAVLNRRKFHIPGFLYRRI